MDFRKYFVENEISKNKLNRLSFLYDTIEENCVNTIHAEINAIAQAAKNGVSIRDSDIYITASPCIHCLKVLINVGIKTIYYAKPYKIEHIAELVTLSGINLIQVTIAPNQ